MNKPLMYHLKPILSNKQYFFKTCNNISTNFQKIISIFRANKKIRDSHTNLLLFLIGIIIPDLFVYSMISYAVFPVYNW